MTGEIKLLQYSDLENVYDDPDRIGRLAGLLDRLRDDRTIVAGTGDNTGPCALSLVTGGRQALDFFSAVEPDLDTFGNHDFDYGLDRMRELVRDSPQSWIASNVRDNGSCFARSAGAVETAQIDRNGASVGFCGLLAPETPAINPTARELSVEDPIPAAREASEQLRAEGADYVVALSHLGALDDDLARATDVDLILGGHDHQERLDTVDGTPIAHPGVNGTAIVEARLSPEGPELFRHSVPAAPRDTHLRDVYADRLAEHGLDTPIAQVSKRIPRSEGDVYAGETRIGNWIADAYRWVSGADVGLQNSGGIRSGPPLTGEITTATCMNLVPFDEPLVVAKLTGAELEQLFRDAVCATPGRRRWHAQVSGVTLVHDEATGRVDVTAVNGERVDPSAEYTLATTKYLLQTEQEFPVLRTDHLVREVGIQYDVLVEHARVNGIESEIEGRILARSAVMPSRVDANT